MDIGYRTSETRVPRCTCPPTFEPYWPNCRPTPVIKKFVLSVKSFCMDSFITQKLFWFYHYHRLFLRVVSSTCKFFPSLSYPKCDILTVSAWTCESRVRLRFSRKGSSFCSELVLVRLALYLMSIKYYQLDQNLLWPQPIKIAKQKQSFQNWRHRGKDVRNSQRKAFYFSIYTGQNGFFISVISEMINGERSEMTGLKLTLIGVQPKMLYPWVSSSSLCADRARVSHIYV